MQSINSWSELDYTNHIFFNSIQEIEDLIKPIRSSFALDSFNYHKTFDDKYQIRLTNKPDWYKHYLSERLYLQSIFELPFFNYSQSRIIWSNIDTHSGILHEASRFGINHGITIVEPDVDGYEFFFLGTTISDSRVINKYLSNFQLLEKFIQNFRIAGKELFTRLYQHKTKAYDWLDNKLQFPSINYIDKFSFLAEVYQYKFTNREIECLPFLLKGCTAKQIAEGLGISFRTVQDYIDNIKIKTNTKTKNELLALLSEKFA